MSEPSVNEPPPPAEVGARRLRLIIVAGVIVLLLALVALSLHAARRTNHVALSHAPRSVTVVRARSATYQAFREYVGATAPWNEAKIGPQYVAAYVASVLFRPGAEVRRGDVLATLDCRYTSAGSRATAARARAAEKRQAAVADEAARIGEMVSGGFASRNELEQLRARAASDRAEIESIQENLFGKNIEVRDCILRAPFDGDVVRRFVDPGAYVRPGEPVLAVVDRSVVRVAADVPEADFRLVAPGTPVRIDLEAVAPEQRFPIARRTPATDLATHTIHVEVDLPNERRLLPVGTLARLQVAVGAPEPATTVPLQAATLRGESATLFVVEDDVARQKVLRVLGQRDGLLYLDPSFAAGSLVVLEGRSLLSEGDRVRWTLRWGPP